MSILDALNDVKKENFDPNKGKVTSDLQLPAGKYNVSLQEVNHSVWQKSGTDYIRFTMQVINGKYAGRQEFITPTLAPKTASGKDMPSFVLARSIKTIAVIGAMVGCQVPDSVFQKADTNVTDAYEDLANLFQDYLGKTMIMNLKLSANKKDPDRPYRNYSFEKMEQPKEASVDDKEDPFKGNAGSEVQINDDDLPF